MRNSFRRANPANLVNLDQVFMTIYTLGARIKQLASIQTRIQGANDLTKMIQPAKLGRSESTDQGFRLRREGSSNSKLIPSNSIVGPKV